MNNNPIGVFDSGIGGATVFKEIRKLLPNENYIYYSDSKNNPYGDKTDEEIFEFCNSITQFLIKRNCKVIVIACNTASAKSAKKLREMYNNIKIIAIEPAYKMVYDYAYNKGTLVMATASTLNSEKFKNLYNKYNNNKTFLCPCIGLADLIEEGDNVNLKKYLKQKLSRYQGKVENVVLGCTHYELIKDEITNVLGNVEFFNGAKGVANYLYTTLSQNDLLADYTDNGSIEFYDSSNSEFKRDRFFKYLEANQELTV